MRNYVYIKLITILASPRVLVSRSELISASKAWINYIVLIRFWPTGFESASFAFAEFAIILFHMILIN